MPLHHRCRGCEYTQRDQTGTLTQSSAAPPTSPWSRWGVVQLYHKRNTQTLLCKICSKTLYLKKRNLSRWYQLPVVSHNLSSLPSCFSLSPKTAASPAEALCDYCSRDSQSCDLGARERPAGLKFECWTKVSPYPLLPCFCLQVSASQHHRDEAAVSVWLMQFVLCRFCKTWLRPWHSLTMKSWDSSELWFETLCGAGGLSWHAGVAQKKRAWTSISINISWLLLQPIKEGTNIWNVNIQQVGMRSSSKIEV